MLDREAAFAVAVAYLEEETRDWETKVRAMPDQAFIDGSVLIVPYAAVAWLDHRDEGAMLGGNMPVRVDLNTGECDDLGLDDVLAYRRRGLL